MKRPWVIKAGGELLATPATRNKILTGIKRCRRQENVVFMHGGGPQIEAELKRNHVEARFVGGRRVTTPEAMVHVERILSGEINKGLAAQLQKMRVNAVGLSCRDGQTVVGLLAVGAAALMLTIWHRADRGYAHFSWPIGPITIVGGLAAVWAALSGVWGVGLAIQRRPAGAVLALGACALCLYGLQQTERRSPAMGLVAACVDLVAQVPAQCHVEPQPDDNMHRPRRLRAHFDENAAELPVAGNQIIGPLQLHTCHAL